MLNVRCVLVYIRVLLRFTVWVRYVYVWKDVWIFGGGERVSVHKLCVRVLCMYTYVCVPYPYEDSHMCGQ